jgi:hypothetical protein
MNSDPRKMLLAAFVLAGMLASVHGCVQVDVYQGPREHGLADSGSPPSDARVVTSEASSDAACRQCVAGQCAPEWKDCQNDPDCLTCFDDPLGKRCQSSAKRHDFRNCACARTACLNACPGLCPTPASLGEPPGARIADDCIKCTSNFCSQEVTACLVDSVCLACVTDSANPKCLANQYWNQTADCTCGRSNTCFEECCGARP